MGSGCGLNADKWFNDHYIVLADKLGIAMNDQVFKAV